MQILRILKAYGWASFLVMASGLEADEKRLSATTPKPTVAEAAVFLDEAETKLLELGVEAGQASWVQSTYITDDTDILAATAGDRLLAATVDFAKRDTRFDKLTLPTDLARKMKLLKLAFTLTAPADPQERQELTRIAVSLENTYGKKKYCPGGNQPCQTLQDLTPLMANSRNPAKLLKAWRGWHAIAPPM